MYSRSVTLELSVTNDRTGQPSKSLHISIFHSQLLSSTFNFILFIIVITLPPPAMSSTSQSDTEISTPIRSINDDQFTMASFRALQCEEERRLLDVVDDMRRRGLNGTIELPQLVVSGDQSSGKSSVLEAITEIPFPRNEGLCTRFATEIVLRRSPASTIVVKIIPSKGASPQERKKLEGFQSSIEEFNHLPEVIEDATAMMGLGKVDRPGCQKFSQSALQAAKEELGRIITDKDIIMTYNPSFTSEIQKQRQTKHAKIAQRATHKATIANFVPGSTRTSANVIRLQQAMANNIEQNQDKFSAEEALDYTRAYYKNALSHFVHSVVVHVIERHLVKDLPDTIFSLVKVSKMTDQEVSFVAAEPKATTLRRNHLEEKKKMLQKGLDTFKEAMGGLKL
ncbi:uncharacterized protein K460DRAFT_351933 [Cucurbitaria berberidis CBS 394.84]|uniref:GED domain-containing protein n=1 Tax=Cucurbitaria berberidis CBS 394.84 TaxID=1168544 RepID=A0A9P4GV39_9PLEO|nr:uncharacterized protein K460DRAFT_351933 [Cucurbitaria berberidis CBS 394.84]KAF1852089.1 hypothetical protein K460DRAFT_351933 [Cucurbitaria berberidis CBS 394.84]